MKKSIKCLLIVFLLCCSNITYAAAKTVKTVKTGPIDYELYEYAEKTLLTRFSQADIGTPFLVANNAGSSAIVFPLFQKDQVTETIILYNDASYLYYMVSSLYTEQLNALEGPMLFFTVGTDHYVFNEDDVHEVLIHSWPKIDYRPWLEEFDQSCPLAVNIYDYRGNIEKIIQNIPYYAAVVYDGAVMNGSAVIMNQNIYVPVSLLSTIDPAIKVNWNAQSKQLCIDFSNSDAPNLVVSQVLYKIPEKECTTRFKNGVSTSSEDTPIILNGRSYVLVDLLDAYVTYSLSEGQLDIAGK